MMALSKAHLLCWVATSLAMTALPCQGQEAVQDAKVELGQTVKPYAMVLCERDGTGRLWALMRIVTVKEVEVHDWPRTAQMIPADLPPDQRESDMWFCTREEGSWRLVLVNGRACGRYPAVYFLGPAPDGSVVLHREQEQDIFLVKGLEGRIIDVSSQDVRQAGVYKDSLGICWTIQNDPNRFSFPKAKPMTPILQLDNKEGLVDRYARLISYLPRPYMVTPDHLGRVWTAGTGPGFPGPKRNGIFLTILDPREDTIVPSIEPKPWRDIFRIMILGKEGVRFKNPGAEEMARDMVDSLTPPVEGHCWAIYGKSGLWHVNMENLSAVQYPAKNGITPKFKSAITAGKESFAFTGNALWHLDGKVWRHVQDHHAPDPSPESMTVAPQTALTDKGLWIAFPSMPLWFIPRGAKDPLALDWRNGIPLSQVKKVDSLDGQAPLLLRGLHNGRSVLYEEDELLSYLDKPKRFERFDSASPFLRDADERLYAIRKAQDDCIERWDGKAWSRIQIPRPSGKPGQADESSEPSSAFPAGRKYLAMDQDDRLWVMSAAPGGACAVLDTENDTWTVHESYPAALKAQPGKQTIFTSMEMPGRSPVYGPGGQAACFTDHNVLVYDGTRWSHHSLKEITGQAMNPLDRPCFFTPEGKLYIGTWRETWEFAPGNGWSKMSSCLCPDVWAKEPEKGREHYRDVFSCTHGTPGRVVQDRLGRYWGADRGRLALAGFGECTNLTGSSREAHLEPLEKMDAALVDCAGNTFLHYENDGHHYIMVPPFLPSADTIVRDHKFENDSLLVVLELPKGFAGFVWRSGEGEWRGPLKGQRIRLEGLSPGEQRIEVAAMGTGVNIDPTPAGFSVVVPGQVQPPEPEPKHTEETPPPREPQPLAEEDPNLPTAIAKWIEDLRAADFAVREAAIESLARHPRTALVPLGTARRTATGDRRWWIDAAIERVLKAKATMPAPEPPAPAPEPAPEPKPKGAKGCLTGTAWKIDNFEITFREDGTIRVNGGPLAQIMPDGAKGRYKLDGDNLELTVMGKTLKGSWDGTTLELDGMKAERR